MKTEEYKFGYVRDLEVVVFNNSIYSFQVIGKTSQRKKKFRYEKLVGPGNVEKRNTWKVG